MNTMDSTATDYLFAKADRMGIPLGATFELSPVCNLSCKMCYVRMTRQEVDKLGGEKTADEWLDIARQCRDEGTLYLLLTGGEPFFYKDFKYLFTELKKMGFILSINSNGTMLDDDMLDWLIQNPPNKINITMYGASNETYKRLCNSPDGYTRVTHAIRRLKQAGITVVINASLTPNNIDDYEKIFNFAKEVKANLRATSYMFPPIRRDKESFGKNERFTPKDAGKYAVKISVDKIGIEKFCDNVKLMENEIEKAEEKIKKGINKNGKLIPCRAGRNTFWISWDGKMTGCGMMQEPVVAYPFEEGFKQSWQKILTKIKESKVLKECCNCKYIEVCKPCVAMCYTESGDINKKPNYVCEMTKTIIKESKKYCKFLEK